MTAISWLGIMALIQVLIQISRSRLKQSRTPSVNSSLKQSRINSVIIEV